MAGSRSPNYPQISLPEAIEKLRELRRKVGDQRERSPKELAAAMGYSDLNGAAQGAISALRKYGLLIGGQGALAISQQALDLLHLPARSAGRNEALQKAVVGYPLFRELLAAQSSGQESTLHHRLVSQGFSDKAADRLLEIYRETLGLLDEEGVVIDRVPAPEGGAPPPAVPSPAGPADRSGSSPDDEEQEAQERRTLEVEITHGTTQVKISVRGNGAPISPEVIGVLQALIALAGSPAPR